MSKKDEPKTLFITNRTLKYGSQTYQIRNLTHVGKYEVEKKHEIGDSAIGVSITVFIISIIAASSHQGAYFFTFISGLVIIAAIAEYMKPQEFALGLETNAASTRVFSSTNEKFIDSLVNKITEIMDNDKEQVSYTVSIADNSIIDNSETVMGNKFENVSHSNITNANKSVVVNSILNQATTLDPVLQEALDKISSVIKNNAASETLFNNFKDELGKTTPNESILKNYWDGLITLSPGVSKVADALLKILNFLN